MKNTEFYTVDKEKLFHLINTVIGLYQVIDDHYILVTASLNHGERAKKSEMRALTVGLIDECFELLESIGCPRFALREDDEAEMFEGILDMLGIDFGTYETDNEDAETEPSNLECLLNQLCAALTEGKQITVSANINIDSEKEE